MVDTSYTVAVTWLKSGTVINSNFRTNVSNVTQLSLFSYEATLTLNPLSSAVDTGTYTCRVTVTPAPPSSLVRGVTHFDTETITVQGTVASFTTLLFIYFYLVPDPTLVVLIDPVTLTVLDTPPYNLISVMCSVTQPPDVTVSKRISWQQTSPSGAVQALSHDGLNTNITDISLESAASTSTLSLYPTMAGLWKYTCRASIQIPGDSAISYAQNVSVNVKGKSNFDKIIINIKNYCLS